MESTNKMTWRFTDSKLFQKMVSLKCEDWHVTFASVVIGYKTIKSGEWLDESKLSPLDDALRCWRCSTEHDDVAA